MAQLLWTIFFELNDAFKGDVIEGEFKDGKHHL